MIKNFTPIDDLVHEYNAMKYGSGSSTKEVFPTRAQEISQKDENMEEYEEEKNDTNAFVTPKKDVSISLPPDLKKAGVQVSNDDTQFKEAMYKIKLPISDEKIVEDLKASPTESKRWYATILLYMLQSAHLTLKKVGAKVIRVFK